tara:strand:- start:750 stop:992 length:243 start_codon:yes stop_codon:yes gene_type:complete
MSKVETNSNDETNNITELRLAIIYMTTATHHLTSVLLDMYDNQELWDGDPLDEVRSCLMDGIDQLERTKDIWKESHAPRT